ncbi:MAG: SUMF1/EgtB/PvdO family nonheme iron enzyme [Verrucomicrobiales bacterium]
MAFDNFFFIKRNDAPVRMRWAQVNRLTGSGVLGYADLRLPNAAGVRGGDFRMARYEVTNAQYARFLNAVDPEGANALDLYDARMTSALEGGIIRNTSRPAGHRYYTVRHMADKPANFIDLPDAARFANWLHSGQADPAYTESGAYGSVGASSVGVRAAAARVFLPTEGEWHMAAYHAGGGARFATIRR